MSGSESYIIDQGLKCVWYSALTSNTFFWLRWTLLIFHMLLLASSRIWYLTAIDLSLFSPPDIFRKQRFLPAIQNIWSSFASSKHLLPGHAQSLFPLFSTSRCSDLLFHASRDSYCFPIHPLCSRPARKSPQSTSLGTSVTSVTGIYIVNFKHITIRHCVALTKRDAVWWK